MADFFQKRLFPHDLHHTAGLHAELARRLPAAGRVLDLGCGANHDLARYRTKTREVWGTDFEAHAELQHADWFRPLHPDGSIPFPDETFDAVASIMVMEHVADPAAYFNEITRVLRPGGVFIGHTISGTHYVTLIRRLVGLAPHSFSQWLVRKLYGRHDDDTFPTCYRLNTQTQIVRAAANMNLAQLARYEDYGYFRFFRPLSAAAVIADRIGETIAPGLGRLYLTVTLQKAVPVAPSIKIAS